MIGLRVSSAARTVSAGECGILTSLTWTRGSLHTDVTAAERSPFGALSLPGPVIVAIAAGLLASSELMPVLARAHGIRLTALVGSRCATYVRCSPATRFPSTSRSRARGRRAAGPATRCCGCRNE